MIWIWMQLHYRVVSGNSADLIHLNETTGYISLSSNLNTNVPISAAMEISVSGKSHCWPRPPTLTLTNDPAQPRDTT